ncbi:recQ-mediated genome instability protein 2 [Mustelus asterias]
MERAPGCAPPLKLLSGQLRQCEPRGAGGSGLLLRREGGRAPLRVGAVWMQGEVQEVRAQDNTSLRLLDPSGCFTVTGAAAAPRGRPCLAAGKYVMVMGVVQARSPEPVIRAVKLTDLSGNALHRSMWELEVEDFHQNIP